MQTFIVHSLKKLFRLLVLLGFILPLLCAFLIIGRLNDCWKRQLTTGRDSRTYGQLFFYNAKAGQFAISIRGTYFSELSVAFENRSSQPDNPTGLLFQLPPLSFESGLKTEVITLFDCLSKALVYIDINFGETLMRIRSSILLQVAFQLEAGINTTGYSVSVFALVNILRFDPYAFLCFLNFTKLQKRKTMGQFRSPCQLVLSINASFAIAGLFGAPSVLFKSYQIKIAVNFYWSIIVLLESWQNFLNTSVWWR